MAKARLDGSMLVQIALGVFLAVLGIYGIQSAGGDFAGLQNHFSGNPGAEVYNAMRDIFGRDMGKVIAILIAVVELAAGAFLLLELFVLKSSSLTDLLLFIVLIFWIAFVVYTNLYLGLIKAGRSFDLIPWLYSTSINLLVLAGLLQVRGK